MIPVKFLIDMRGDDLDRIATRVADIYVVGDVQKAPVKTGMKQEVRF